MKHLRWVIVLALLLGACVREIVLVAPPLDGGIGDAFIDDTPGDTGIPDAGGAD